jgi:hypothetical protein
MSINTLHKVDDDDDDDNNNNNNNNNNNSNSKQPQPAQYTDLKEQLIKIRQLKSVYTVPLVLSTRVLSHANDTKV